MKLLDLKATLGSIDYYEKVKAGMIIDTNTSCQFIYLFQNGLLKRDLWDYMDACSNFL